MGAAFLFSFVGGFITDKYNSNQDICPAAIICVRLGRKPAIIIAAVIFTAGAITMGAANNKEVLLVGRIILGMGIGRALD